MTTPIYDPWSSVTVQNDHGLQYGPSRLLTAEINTVGRWRMRPRTVICSEYLYGTIGALIHNFYEISQIQKCEVC